MKREKEDLGSESPQTLQDCYLPDFESQNLMHVICLGLITF